MHEENCFLTLTYNNKHLPEDGSVSKKEMQAFMKKLRRKIEPKQVKFYLCGEYGDKLERPHYHVLLFGFDFVDKELHHVSDPKKKNRFSTGSMYQVYKSKLLSEIWTKGFSSVGDVSLESAGYVARYIGKKIGGERAKGHYKGKEPEFALMSRNPGIGASWIKKYFWDVYPKDFYTIDGRKFKPPRFFDERLKRKCWPMYEEVKERRKANARDEDIIRRRDKEKYLKEVTKTLERDYENG